MAENPRTTGGGADEESGRFDKARDYVNDKYSAASDGMKNQYNRFKEKVDDVDFGEVSDQVRTYVRSNPGKALLISVGVGFVIGMLLRRDEGEED